MGDFDFMDGLSLMLREIQGKLREIQEGRTLKDTVEKTFPDL